MGEADKEVAIEIFVFLIGLGCLVLFLWAIASLSKLVADQKYRRRNRLQRRSPSAPPESKQQRASKPTNVKVQPSKVVALKQPPISTRVRLLSKKHQQYIRLAKHKLKRLRDHSPNVQLL